MAEVTVRVLPYGPGALLAEVDGAADVAALHAWLVAGAFEGVRALVPAARTVLVEAEPRQLGSIGKRIKSWEPAAGDAAALAPIAGNPVVEVPVVYDGEDLKAVAQVCGLTAGEVVRRHSEPLYTAAFCGFSPGFAYLIGGDPALRLPRRADPRTRVPAGSVAIAGEFSAVYPSPSPGGWHLLGRTSLTVWDVEREAPALIAPGTRVRFRPARMLRWP